MGRVPPPYMNAFPLKALDIHGTEVRIDDIVIIVHNRKLIGNNKLQYPLARPGTRYKVVSIRRHMIQVRPEIPFWSRTFRVHASHTEIIIEDPTKFIPLLPV